MPNPLRNHIAKLAAEAKAAEKALDSAADVPTPTPATGGLFGFVRKAATGEPMNRREFLAGSAQAAGAAAAARVPTPAVKVAGAVAESPYLDASLLEDFTGIGLDSIDKIGGQDRVLRAQLPMSWWGGADSAEAFDAHDRLRRELFAAYRSRPSTFASIAEPRAGKSGELSHDTVALPYEWNRKTGQWHAVVHDPDIDSQVYLKAGATPPSGVGYPYGWETAGQGMDMGLEAYGATPGELSAVLSREHAAALRHALQESGIDPQKARDNPRYAEQATKYARERGLAPGGRNEPLGLLGPPGLRVRPGDQSDLSVSSEYEPQPNRRDWRRHGVLGGLMLPAAVPAQEERR